MKFKIASDLHVEFGGDYRLDRDSTYLIAGDVGPIGHALKYLNNLPDDIRVYYIAGNHEFYGYDISLDYAQLREGLRDKENVTFLQDEYVKVDDVYIYGTTLWTDLESEQFNPEQLMSMNVMNDFRTIKSGKNMFKPSDMRQEHYASRKLLQEFLETHEDDKVIVMSHQLPSFRSVHPMYGGSNSPMNYYFASHLDKLIERYQPNYWVHGHTHKSVDYHIGETHVMCYPIGYPNENQRLIEGSLEI